MLLSNKGFDRASGWNYSSKTMLIACVIVTYNRKVLLKSTFNAVSSQTYHPDYIIIVDNNSADGTKEWLSELKDSRSDVIALFLKQNLGGAGGFHFGIKKACELGADWIWTLDDDSLPDQDALEKLVKSGLIDSGCSGEGVGFLASRVIWKDGTIHKMNVPGFVKAQHEGYKRCNENTRIYYSSFVSILISMKAVKKVGLPIQQFFIYGDDVEFTRRITSDGFSAYYIPSSRTVHLTEVNAGITYDQITDNTLDLEKRCRIVRNLVIVNKQEMLGKLKEVVRIIYIWLILVACKTPLRSQARIVMAGLKGLFINQSKWIKYPDNVQKSRFLFTLHNFYPDQLYGTEKVCIQQMRELLKRGHRVGLFYSCNSPVSEKQLKKNGLEGLELFRVKFLFSKAQVLLSAWKPHVSYRFSRVVDEFSPDVVVFHHLVRLSMDLPLVVRKKSIKKILYLHDFYLICPSYSLFRENEGICRASSMLDCARCLFAGRFGQNVIGMSFKILPAFPFLLMRNIIRKRVAENIDCFVSPSGFMVSELKRRGVEIKTCIHNPNGMDRITNVEEKKITGSLCFGYIGNIHKKKGVDVLVQAFHGDIGKNLVIRGFSDDNAVQDFMLKYPDFSGTLEVFNNNRQSFYNNVDVIIVPSVWYENQPTVIIEALNYGKPVICSDTGGMPEMVTDNKGGLLFRTGVSDDLREKVMYLINNPSEVVRMKESLPKWPTVEENVDKLLKAVS